MVHNELSSDEKDLNRDSNPDLCDAGAVLYQLNYHANWLSTAPASQGYGFKSPLRPEFFKPLLLLLKYT